MNTNWCNFNWEQYPWTKQSMRSRSECQMCVCFVMEGRLFSIILMINPRWSYKVCELLHATASQDIQLSSRAIDVVPDREIVTKTYRDASMVKANKYICLPYIRSLNYFSRGNILVPLKNIWHRYSDMWYISSKSLPRPGEWPPFWRERSVLCHLQWAVNLHRLTQQNTTILYAYKNISFCCTTRANKSEGASLCLLISDVFNALLYFFLVLFPSDCRD